MKKHISILFLLILLPVFLFSQMSDNQVKDFVKVEHAKGTSQQVIGTSLLQKGVTKDQLERIKKQVEQEQQSTLPASGANTTPSSVLRTVQVVDESNSNTSVDDSTSKQNVFGRNIFNKKNISFAPNVNIPTPANYKLGTGDEIVIDVWGVSQTTIRKTISPEGTINIDNIGPIFLSGMTIESANTLLKRRLSNLYSGVDYEGGTSNIKLTLGQIRTIQINIMGEVDSPGTYSVSSLASVFHALYLAGGISDIGSLREVNLYRAGQKVTSIDIYDFLLQGKLSDDIRLFDGDLIIVPPYKALVNIAGQIKRPMYYEMTEDETVDNLINYAGGLTGGAFSDGINLMRKTGGYDKIFTINTKETESFTLKDGDIVTIGGGLNLYENRIQIQGRVFRPGYYEIGKDIKSVVDLIEKAGGLRGDAFLDRAILTREKDDLTFETFAINLNDIATGKSNDLLLKKNDVLFIAAKTVDKDLGNFTIVGMVAKPGQYKFAHNTTIKDLILKAGGLLSSASTAKVDVSRRIVNPASTTNTEIIAQTFSFSIVDGLVENGQANFILEPYDEIYIRRSPGYQTQRNVLIEGEVLFPGTYTLTEKKQHLSDLIKNVGGITPAAFTQGARLTRIHTKSEQEKQKKSLEMMSRGVLKDSTTMADLEIDVEYTIGIELDKAIANPKSEYDIVLKPNDKLYIPEFDNTIKINGAVMYPNTVLFKEGKSLKYYIEQAGGYADLAQKKRAYVIYMNGTIAKANGSSKNLIKPGCEIIVPVKEATPKTSLGEKIAIGSSVTSMASVVALLINSLTK